MSERRDRWDDQSVLRRRALRIPLPDVDAERLFYENMRRVADARERKADLLADPDVPLLEAYEVEIDLVTDAFEHRLESTVGGDYREVAAACARGERDDRVARVAAYYVEALWLMQEQTTVTDMLFAPLILRYPDCVTVNVRFTDGFRTPESVVYESPEQSRVEVSGEHLETYYAESTYSQRQAAERIRETTRHLRDAFPDPDAVPFEERKYGGIVAASGRRGSAFSDYLGRVDPDPDRFGGPATDPALVPEGPEARRTERSLLGDGDVIF